MNLDPNLFEDDSEETQRLRVDWQEKHFGLDDRFFAGLLRTDQEEFSAWRCGTITLGERPLLVLQFWWDALLHLLPFHNYDDARIRDMFEAMPREGASTYPSLYNPPWLSEPPLKEYLRTHGPEAIDQMDRWVALFQHRD